MMFPDLASSSHAPDSSFWNRIIGSDLLLEPATQLLRIWWPERFRDEYLNEAAGAADAAVAWVARAEIAEGTYEEVFSYESKSLFA
jgi:hypothetical protein